MSSGSVMCLFPAVLSRFLHRIAPAGHKLASSLIAELGEVRCILILSHPFPFINSVPQKHHWFQYPGAMEFLKFPGHHPNASSTQNLKISKRGIHHSLIKKRQCYVNKMTNLNGKNPQEVSKQDTGNLKHGVTQCTLQIHVFLVFMFIQMT